MSATTHDISALRRKLEACELPHAAFTRHLAVLESSIDDALDGYAPRIEKLVGPTQVGKSMLVHALKRRYPETGANGIRRFPVLVVLKTSGTSSVDLLVNVLEALQVPIPPGNPSDSQVNKHLKIAQTRVLILDKSCQLAEPGTKSQDTSTSEWLVSLVERMNITVVMLGTERLRKLFSSNPSFRSRAFATHEFRPYDWNEPQQMLAFSTCVKTYADLFANHGWPIALSMETLAKHCYLLSGGLLGILSRFMQKLAERQKGCAPKPLTFEECFDAASAIECFGHPDFPAFVRQDVSSIELSQAHSYTLELNDMAMPRFASLREAN